MFAPGKEQGVKRRACAELLATHLRRRWAAVISWGSPRIKTGSGIIARAYRQGGCMGGSNGEGTRGSNTHLVEMTQATNHVSTRAGMPGYIVLLPTACIP